MKRYYNMLRSIAVMAIFGLMASCTIQEEAELVNRPDAFNHYYATIEETSAPDTKVYADEQLKVLWNAGDCISVFGKYTYNQEYVFKGQTGDNSGTFEKVENGAYVTGNDLPSVWAVYPYMETTSISNDGELSVVFPSVQSYADKTFGLGANVMVSATDDNNLKFRNAGGVLVIKLYGNGVSVNSVSLKGNKGEKIAGAATVTMAVGGTPAVVMGDQATDAITLACAEPVAIGSSADSCTEFWFVLPPTEFQDGITVSVNGEGGVFEKSTAKAISITRNHLSRMAPVEVSLSYPVPEAVDLGLPSGTFWASWNLGASSPKEKGELFAWGEYKPKKDYTWANYIWCNGSASTLTKYNSDSSCGQVDHLTYLKLEDDAAHILLGKEWRIPTDAEVSELFSGQYTSFSVSDIDGILGYVITSKTNGNSIFVPMEYSSGNNWYYPDESYACWTSSAVHTFAPEYYDNGDIYGYSPSAFYFSSERYQGHCIRPVLAEYHDVTGISVDKDSAEVPFGSVVILTASVTPANATHKDVVWICDDDDFVKISAQSGNWLDAGACYASVLKPEGTATIRAYANGAVSEVTLTAKPASFPEPVKVDLGLPSGLKWASCNLGAQSSEDSGTCFSWGETAPKGRYDKWDYKYYEEASSSYSKYNSKDALKVLATEDDAASMLLGEAWRVPAYAEWEELLANCSKSAIKQNGVDGVLLTSRINGNCIFFPESISHPNSWIISRNAIWTASHDDSKDDYVTSITFNTATGGLYIDKETERAIGNHIRPVYDDRVPVESITLSNAALELTKGNTHQLVATLSPANAYGKLIWSSSAPSVASVSDEGLVTAIGAGSATISATSYNGLSATCEITVARDNNALRAKWRFTTGLLSNYANYFGGTSGIVDKEEGFGGLYVPSNVEGNGRIEYYQIDKSAYSVSGNPKRMVGATGHPYVTGVWPGDYWLFSASDGHEYPAGTQLHIKYLTRISATGQKYWMLEYFDGEAWKQAKEYEVSTEAETGTSAQYNYIAKTSNETVECSWTLAAPCSEPKFRMRCVANWQSNGNGALAKPNGGTSRIADNDDDGEDAGPVLEVTSEP